MGSSGRSRLGPAKRCGTAIFGKLFASCFFAVADPHKQGSALGKNWYDSRGSRRPHADWIPASLISYGIFGGDNKSRLFIPFGDIHCLYIRWGNYLVATLSGRPSKPLKVEPGR